MCVTRFLINCKTNIAINGRKLLVQFNRWCDHNYIHNILFNAVQDIVSMNWKHMCKTNIKSQRHSSAVIKTCRRQSGKTMSIVGSEHSYIHQESDLKYTNKVYLLIQALGHMKSLYKQATVDTSQHFVSHFYFVMKSRWHSKKVNKSLSATERSEFIVALVRQLLQITPRL